jgi:hypothetical protein
LLSGLFATFLTTAPWLFLYVAVVTLIGAGWYALFVWLGSSMLERRYHVRMIVGDCVLSVLFAAIWLLPMIAVPICIASFIVSDWLVVLIMTNALLRSRIFSKASDSQPT